MKVYTVQICTTLCDECIEKMEMRVDDVVKFDEVEFQCSMCGRSE